MPHHGATSNGEWVERLRPIFIFDQVTPEGYIALDFSDKEYKLIRISDAALFGPYQKV